MDRLQLESILQAKHPAIFQQRPEFRTLWAEGLDTVHEQLGMVTDIALQIGDQLSRVIVQIVGEPHQNGQHIRDLDLL